MNTKLVPSPPPPTKYPGTDHFHCITVNLNKFFVYSEIGGTKTFPRDHEGMTWKELVNLEISPKAPVSPLSNTLFVGHFENMYSQNTSVDQF